MSLIWQFFRLECFYLNKEELKTRERDIFMSGIGSMMMNNQTAQMYTQILANMSEMSKQNAEAMKKYAETRQEAKKTEYKQQLEALEKQEAAEKEEFISKATQKQKVTATEDGKDDGSISLWSKIKNIGKGAVKTVKGMFCDENGFSLKRTLTTVGVAAACAGLIVVTGGAATPFLVGAGIAMGGANIVKGGIKAAAAQTDAQAEAAWQDIGGGTTEVALALTGAKAAVKTAPKGNWFTSSLRAGKECLVKTGKQAWQAVRHPQKTYRAASDFMKTEGKANWEAMFKSNKAKNNKIAEIDKKYAQEIEKLQSKQKQILDEITELNKDASKNAKKIDAKNKEYDALERSINEKNVARELHAENRADGYEGYKSRKNEIKSDKETVETLKNERKTLKDKSDKTDVDKGRIKEIDKDIELHERYINENERINNLELQETKITRAQERLQRTEAERTTLAEELKLKQDAFNSTSDKDLKLSLIEDIKSLTTKLDKKDKFIKRNQDVITKAKHTLHKDNAIAFVKTGLKPNGLQIGNTAAATNGFLFGTTVIPQQKEVTVKAEGYEQMEKQLADYQAARRKQLEAQYKQQTTVTNPMSFMQGMNTGTSPLSMFPPEIPQII